MAEHDLDMGGLPEEHAPEKGRQRVRRHWKPSLRRFVDVYSRKGEHARPGDPASGDSLGEERPRSRRGRRKLVVIAGFVVLAALGAGAWKLMGEKPTVPPYEILEARDPALVKVTLAPAKRLMTYTKADLDKLVAEAIKPVREADRVHPDRLIVLDLQMPPMAFASLTLQEQRELRSTLGATAARRYEVTVGGLLARIVASVGHGRASVLGLPVEPREAGAANAARTNDCYGDVITGVNHLVSGHVFYRGDRSQGEEDLVEQAISEVLHRRGDRPVLFREGTSWRVLVTRGKPAPDQEAARRLVLADGGR